MQALFVPPQTLSSTPRNSSARGVCVAPVVEQFLVTDLLSDLVAWHKDDVDVFAFRAAIQPFAGIRTP